MESLYLLLPIALFFFGIAIGLFFWAVSNKQFDDLDRESQRILFDKKTTSPKSSTKPQSHE